MRLRSLHVILLIASGGCVAGSSQSAGTDVLTRDSVNPPNEKAPPAFPEAAHPALMQVVKAAGSVIARPVVRVVTFDNDADAAQIEAFASALGPSPYWSAVTAEYGVGALSAAASVRDTFAWPATATDGDASLGESSDIEKYLISKLDGASPAWGAPDPSTLYTLVLPAGTQASTDGTQTSACDAGLLAWHTALVLPTRQTRIHYVVAPNCGAMTGMTSLDSRTFALSHAWVEGVTDPEGDGYGVFDANHTVWQLAAGNAEVTSACNAQQDGAPTLVADANAAGLTYAVHRSWSNAAAAAGHAPCVPAGKDVYFDAVPSLTDANTFAATVSSIAGAPTVPAGGVKVAQGQSVSIALNLVSDAQTTPWQVAATEVGTRVLTLALDKTQGNNGDVLHVTVTVSGAPTTRQQVVKIMSTQGTLGNAQYILIHQ